MNAEYGSPRAVLLDSTLQAHGYSCFRPGVPTRHGTNSATEIDYAYISRVLAAEVSRRRNDNNHLLVHCGSRLEISSDHDRVTLRLAIEQRSHKKSRRRRPNKGKCGRWTASSALPDHLSDISSGFQQLDLHGKWEAIKNIQQTCSYRTPSQKSKDSEDLKQLCRERRLCEDSQRRLELTRVILARRRAERLQWLRDLENNAANGDAHAISYLRARAKQHTDMDGLIREAGGIKQAAEQIRDHFTQLFHPAVPEEQQQRTQEILEELQLDSGGSAPVAFTDEEISEALSKGKNGKTMGLSGVSYELLVALWGLDEGKVVLREFLSDLYLSADHPRELYKGFVALIPKVSQVVMAQQLRPINLIEPCNKLYCRILLQRLVGAWEIPPCQCGGVSGSQVLDALATAHWQVYLEGAMQQERVWFNADVRSPFDSVHHSFLASWIRQNTPSYLSREALQLLHVVLCPHLVFSWQGEDWEIDQVQGVQQGHTYSSAFSVTSLAMFCSSNLMLGWQRVLLVMLASGAGCLWMIYSCISIRGA